MRKPFQSRREFQPVSNKAILPLNKTIKKPATNIIRSIRKTSNKSLGFSKTIKKSNLIGGNFNFQSTEFDEWSYKKK